MRRRYLKAVKDFINNYLTIEALEDELTVSLQNTICLYCIDGNNKWKLLDTKKSITINSGQTISFKDALYSRAFGCGTFVVNKKFNLVGNAMSMLFGDNAKNIFDLSNYPEAFRLLFSSCSTLQSVSPNFLPATTLVYSCYSRMFWNCTSLTTAPKLPATTLADYCYSSMFQGCSSLTTAPELPATTLEDYCYHSMFYGCTSLTTAPELPATTLAKGCYYYMFQYCSSLTTAPELPATTLAGSCYSRMFWNCTSLTTAPELPATTLVSYCYYSMFYNCSKLNYIKMLATNLSASSCLSGWVYNVASSGTFVKHPDMTTLPIGLHGIPEGWTIVNDGEESGSKIENYLRKGKTSTTKQVLTLDFPAETNLNVYYTISRSGSTRSTFQRGNSTLSIGLGPGESIVSVDRLDPNEDNVYIYKIDYE